MPAGLSLQVRKPIIFPISTPILISTSRDTSQHVTLVVWDAQTGVVILNICIQYGDKIIFHGDQRTITVFWNNTGMPGEGYNFHTYNALNGTLLCQGDGLATPWAHKDTLQFATSSWTNGKYMVNIHGFQPTLTPPLHVLSSFLIPYCLGEFSFSPISFHASFVLPERVVILDVQNSKCLLETKVALANELSPQLGQFSPDGHFFACKKSEHEICVWQNTSTHYAPWGNLRSRLPFEEFSWSPTSLSILCWGVGGVQLLHPGRCSGSLPPNRTRSSYGYQKHLVAYSADWMHIATVQRYGSIITVVNCLSGIPQQHIVTHMEIWGIGVADSTMYAIGGNGLVSWDLGADGITYDHHSTRRVAVDWPLKNESVDQLTFSYDCSQIVYIKSWDIFIYNVESQKLVWMDIEPEPGNWIEGARFSLDGSQLWLTDVDGSYYFVGLEELGDWNSTEEGVDRRDTQKMVGGGPEDGELLFNHSSHGCSCEFSSGWVVDSQGRELLWLPPSWRSEDWGEVRWDGDFLTLLHSHHPEPIIIEFKP